MELQNEPFSLDHEKVVVETLLKAFYTLLTAYNMPLEDDQLRLTSEDFCPGTDCLPPFHPFGVYCIHHIYHSSYFVCTTAVFTPTECSMFHEVLALRVEEKMIIRDYIDLLKSYEEGLLKV